MQTPQCPTLLSAHPGCFNLGSPKTTPGRKTLRSDQATTYNSRTVGTAFQITPVSRNIPTHTHTLKLSEPLCTTLKAMKLATLCLLVVAAQVPVSAVCAWLFWLVKCLVLGKANNRGICAAFLGYFGTSILKQGTHGSGHVFHLPKLYWIVFRKSNLHGHLFDT